MPYSLSKTCSVLSLTALTRQASHIVLLWKKQGLPWINIAQSIGVRRELVLQQSAGA
jgi:hypothetical protein